MTPSRPNKTPSPGWRARLQRLLRDTFGLRRLRAGQADVIERLMAGQSVLAIMPTGAGKSLCYQLPALLLPGRTVVVSPLIALMKDQCDKLVELGLNAVQVHSGLSAGDLAAAEQAVEDGTARFVFTTPERLAEPAFLQSLRRHPLSLLAVDEVHCLSQWGHDFRPAFLEIGPAIEKLGRPLVLALTATAPPEAVEDVCAQLALPGLAIVNTGVYRPNLHFRVRQVTGGAEDKMARTLAWVREQSGTGLVYAATVKAVEEVYEALLAQGESVARYHGRLGAAERREMQDRFMSGHARVMVATNAFGLGIDKPDIRFVLHHQVPGGLDAYYQEAGRSGRDGEVSRCLLLYDQHDKAVQQFFLVGRYPGPEEVHALYAALHEPPTDGEAWTLASLQTRLERPRGKVQVALKLLRDQGVAAQDRRGRVRLLRPDLGQGALDRLITTFDERREHDRAMLERMVFYARTGFCRWKVLLEHYGEDEGFDRCGTCDNCERAALKAWVREGDEPAPQELPPPTSPRAAFEVGERARVPRYGEGEVTEADADSVTLVFPDGQTRSFVAAYVEKAGPRQEAEVAASPG